MPTPIPGATSSAYVPVVGDIGHTLTVTVVATNSGGSSSAATSASTSAVIAGAGGGGTMDFSVGAAGANTALLGAVL